MTNKDDLKMALKVPEETNADIAHRNVKALLSDIPVIGGSAAEIFEYIYGKAIH